LAYTAEQKASAVELIRSHDGVINDAVLLVVRETLNIDASLRTLYNWWTSASASKKMQNLHSAKVSAKKIANPDEQTIDIPDTQEPTAAIDKSLSTKLRKAADKFIDAATEDDRMAGMKSDRLMTAAGIAIDKLLKLEGVPDIVIDVTVSFVEMAQRKGRDPANIIKAAIDQLAQLPDVEMLTSGSGVN
jgi:hypothetical protein